MVDQRKLQNAGTIFFHFVTMIKRGLTEVLKEELDDPLFVEVLRESCETALELMPDQSTEETAAGECPPHR